MLHRTSHSNLHQVGPKPTWIQHLGWAFQVPPNSPSQGGLTGPPLPSVGVVVTVAFSSISLLVTEISLSGSHGPPGEDKYRLIFPRCFILTSGFFVLVRFKVSHPQNI